MSTLEVSPAVSRPSQPRHQLVNDFSIQVATVNGSGSQTANTVLMRALFQMGIPVSGKNMFPSNIAGLPTWFTIRASKHGWIGRRKEIDFLVAMNPETAREDVMKLESGGAVVSVGPLDGTDINQYTQERQAALAKATGERAAVISVDHYITEAEARALAGQLHVAALLAAPPGGAPSVVTGDMAAWAQAQKASATDQRDQTAELLKNGVDDPDYKAFYQQEVARLNKVLAGIDPNGKVVFGMVVTGPALDLQAMAKHPGVRLVDVAPSAKVNSQTEYRGLRPEQTIIFKQADPRRF